MKRFFVERVMFYMLFVEALPKSLTLETKNFFAAKI